MEKYVSHLLLNENCLHSHANFHQWGFQHGYSTTSALISVVNDWLQCMEKGKSVSSVFFDICKTFDTIPHLLLIKKLMLCGLNKHLLRWICDYLQGREHHVVFNGITSHSRPVISGVPQGSVLGPLLFIFYLDGLTSLQLSGGSTLNVYADDMLLYKCIASVIGAQHFQEDISLISCWVSQHFLDFNIEICRYMVLTRSKGTQDFPNEHRLATTSSYRYLSVTVTSDLSWSVHIHSICNKARKRLGLLYRQFL